MHEIRCCTEQRYNHTVSRQPLVNSLLKRYSRTTAVEAADRAELSNRFFAWIYTIVLLWFDFREKYKITVAYASLEDRLVLERFENGVDHHTNFVICVEAGDRPLQVIKLLEYFLTVQDNSIIDGGSHCPILVAINVKILKIVISPTLMNAEVSLCVDKIQKFLVRQGATVAHDIFVRYRYHCGGPVPLTSADEIPDFFVIVVHCLQIYNI